MKKISGLILCSLVALIGGVILLSGNEKIEVLDVMKGADLELGTATCYTETSAKTYIEQKAGKELKPLLTYMYGNVQAKTADGKDYYCEDPDVAIKIFDICEFDGYFLDAALTKPTNPSTVGDVLKAISYEKDSNGCVTGINYITTLYAKCKSKTTPTPSKPTVTPSTPATKDNPETGDSILLYVGLGILLVAGCGIALKKLAK